MSNNPPYLIVLHAIIEPHKAWFYKLGKIAIARPDKRKSVKGRIWLRPDQLPINTRFTPVVCAKTGRKYWIHPPLVTAWPRHKKKGKIQP